MNPALNPSFSLTAGTKFSKEWFVGSTSHTALAGGASYSKIVNNGATDPQTEVSGINNDAETVNSLLFEATAQAKIWTSKIAMHLDRQVRDRLFRQLDSLHDAEEWVSGERPVNIESYKTCVRAIVHHAIDSGPALSLMPSGNILALWQDGSDKLSIEFLPANRTRWFVQSTSNAGPERAAGLAPLERLREILNPYCADRWFDAG